MSGRLRRKEPHCGLIHPRPSGAPRSFFTLGVSSAQDDVVEVSGFLDTNCALSATYIEKKGVLTIGTTAVNASSLISGFEGSDRFNLGTLTVTFDPTRANTDLADVPGGTIVNGLLSEVKGILVTTVEMPATKIEVKERDF